jgi:ribonuclease/clavin/mitogillin
MRIGFTRHGDVHRLRMGSALGRVAKVDVSVYVFRGVMIDSGFHHARHAVVDAISSLGVSGVLVTHWHEDHAGNVAVLASRGVPIGLRADTEATLRERPHIALYRRLIWGLPSVLDSPVIAFAPTEFECVHTPGHSPDHQVVWHPESGTLFSGDLWLGIRARIMHHAEDPFEIVQSLRKAAALGPARMFDAHRGLVERPVDALVARADWLETMIGEIERRISAGWDDRTIVKRVLGGEERAAYVSRGEYSRKNFVKAVRRRLRA